MLKNDPSPGETQQSGEGCVCVFVCVCLNVLRSVRGGFADAETGRTVEQRRMSVTVVLTARLE